jgi:hypothetical protein
LCTFGDNASRVLFQVVCVLLNHLLQSAQFLGEKGLLVSPEGHAVFPVLKLSQSVTVVRLHLESRCCRRWYGHSP